MTGGVSLLERLAPTPLPGVRAERGRAWFDALGLPDGREEAWRCTPVDDIGALLNTARPVVGGAGGVDRRLVDELAGDHGGPRIVFVNGAFAAHLSDLPAAGPSGLWMGGADALRERTPNRRPTDDEPVDGFHALNWAAGRDVAAVMVMPEVELDEPVHVVHVAVSDDDLIAIHPRSVIRVGPRSRLEVVETFVGCGGRTVTNASTRILASEGASLTYQRLVAEPLDAVHVGRTAVEQSARSTVHAVSVLGGDAIARSAVDVRLGGEGAAVDLDGLHLPAGVQRHDHVVTVDHAAPDCTSTQRFKGVVGDHGRGAFTGHVIVRPGADGTDARQTNPNLLLGSAAQVDTRPWLEIFADDVRCNHGATVGRLDEEALFYLCTRGIARDQARAMLVTAFAEEILDRLASPSVRERVAQLIDGAMPGAPR